MQSVVGRPMGRIAPRVWRATTAIRVFVIAIATGQAINRGELGQTGLLLLSIILIATAASVLDYGALDRGTPWIPLIESVLAATVLISAPAESALFVYLAAPPVVAGVRLGWVTATNTTLTTALAVVGGNAAISGAAPDAAMLATAGSWLVIGFGAGILAGWQTRALRRLEATQAPYAAAHDLLTQLHALTHRVGMGLDSPSMAQDLAAVVGEQANASSATVFIRTATGELEIFARAGQGHKVDRAVAGCFASGKPAAARQTAAFPLRVGDRTFGVLALERLEAWSKEDVKSFQALIAEHALRLETALLFDEVRHLATFEERNRLAREMHDGVAQEIVALGYLVDEVESVTAEPATLATTEALRREISRILAELRLSIYDLRHEVDNPDLSGALAQYVRQISVGSDLRVHLKFDEQGPPLSRRTQAELLRVAQEAINNARKHARAINLWVTLATDGDSITLLVEDDGIGSAGPRDLHYGLHTMRERAKQIGADLTVAERRDGGTVVSLRSTPHTRIEGGQQHEHSGPAGR